MPARPRRRMATVAVVLGVALLLLVLVPVGGFVFAWQQAAVDTRGKVEFDRPLAVPPLQEGRVDADGTRVFELTAQEGRHDLGGDQPSQTWGFNGSYLGPTLRAHRGERVRVDVANELPEATTVHWHGMHLPAAMDGGPHQLVRPGATWHPTWTVDQPAATLWYHPHPHGQTADHVSRGLAGMFLLTDDEEEALDLPRRYGVDDLPVVVQDKDVRGNGNLGNGTGRTIVVNGTPGPYAEVSSERVRLRLLNAATMRVMDFRFDDGGEFDLVATDGGLLPRPTKLRHLRMSPGERAEVVVSLRPGERRVLQSVQPDLGGNVLSNHFDGGAASFDVLELRAADRLTPAPPVPDVLSTSNLATAGSETDDVVRRSFELNGRQINGRSMDMARVDFAPTVDTTELWTVRNVADSAHNFHVHDVQFRVLSVDGRPPSAEYAGLHDTIYLPPKVEFRILMRFADYSDPESPYMVHCHLLRHEDEGMMAQFAVVRPGEEAARPVTRGGGDHDGADHAGGHGHAH